MMASKTTESNKKTIPDPKWVYYLRAWLEPGTKPTRVAKSARAVELAKDDGVELGLTAESLRQATYVWERNEKYAEWFDANYKVGLKRLTPYLDNIGLIKATKDHRYWQDMQKIVRHGDLVEKRQTDVTSGGKRIKFTLDDLIDDDDKDGQKKT